MYPAEAGCLPEAGSRPGQPGSRRGSCTTVTAPGAHQRSPYTPMRWRATTPCGHPPLPHHLRSPQRDHEPLNRHARPCAGPLECLREPRYLFGHGCTAANTADAERNERPMPRSGRGSPRQMRSTKSGAALNTCSVYYVISGRVHAAQGPGEAKLLIKRIFCVLTESVCNAKTPSKNANFL